jgi:hypothetical protein
MNWLNKYKPKAYSDLILPVDPVHRKILHRLYTTGQCSRNGVLLHDTLANGGTGKTTMVSMITDNLNRQIIKLNTTGENLKSLESLKSELQLLYGEQNGFGSAQDCIIVGNEISKSGKNYIDGLREIMDDAKIGPHVLFLLTDNHFDDLSKWCPQIFVGGRITSIDYDTLDPKEITDYCTNILQLEGKNTSDNRKELNKLITSKRNSIRTIISDLEDRV